MIQLLCVGHRTHPSAEQHENEEHKPLVAGTITSIKTERERKIHAIVPHQKHQRCKGQHPVELITEIYTNHIDEDIVHHDEPHKPASAVQNNMIDIPVDIPERAKHERHSQHRGIDAVKTAFVPIREILNAVYRLQEQCEARTEKEQCVTNRATCCQSVILAIE